MAQDSGKGDDTSKPAGEAEAKADAGQDPAAGTPATAEADKPAEALVEDRITWPEPNREQLLRNDFKELPGQVLNDRDRGAVLTMASGGEPADPALIKKYVDSYTSDLTRHANIDAMLGQSDNARLQRALNDAASRLLQPLLEPATEANAAFRRQYISALLSRADALLQGHLYTRTFAMVVLSRTNAEEVIPVFIREIENPEQTYTVKLLAAVGLANVSQQGRRPPEATSRGVPAARALADFLRNAPDAPWPVICRSLEALASLRLATTNPLQGQAEVASVPFELLASEETDAEVRGWAGWALSRLNYPPQVKGLNPDLLAHLLGRVAVALAARIEAIPVTGPADAANLRLVARQARTLIRVLEAYTGSPDVRGSGLSYLPNATPAIRGIEQRVRAVTDAAVKLSQAAGAQIAPARKAVTDAAAELSAYLKQNPPKNAEFFTGGPQVPAAAPPAASAARNTNGG
jgi:hypothetical protein